MKWDQMEDSQLALHDLCGGERGEAKFIDVDFGEGVALAVTIRDKGDQFTLLNAIK